MTVTFSAVPTYPVKQGMATLKDFFNMKISLPSLSQHGIMRLGSKSTLLPILENMATKPACSPVVDALIIDESMAVQMIQLKTARLFQDYCEDVFIPYKKFICNMSGGLMLYLMSTRHQP